MSLNFVGKLTIRGNYKYQNRSFTTKMDQLLWVS